MIIYNMLDKYTRREYVILMTSFISFPAGTDLRGARSKKKLLLGENERRVDFDKGKVERLTFNGQTATWSWPQRNERSRMTSSC